LILLQAGGKISDFNGGENWASGEQVVASNGKVHSLALSLLP
jgi:myo-inositol-1(or 4)-monophosphatase